MAVLQRVACMLMLVMALLLAVSTTTTVSAAGVVAPAKKTMGSSLLFNSEQSQGQGQGQGHLVKTADSLLKLQPVKGAVVPTATLNVHESLFVKVSKAVIPAITAAVKSVVVPGSSSSHFKYGDVRIGSFSLSDIEVAFASPSTVILGLQDLSMAIAPTDFEVMAKILFAHVHCSGQLHASISGASVQAKLALARGADGKLIVAGVTPIVNPGSVSVSPHMNHELCRLGEHIASAVVDLKKKIREMVQDKVVPMISNTIKEKLSGAAATLPFPLASSPVATSDSMSMTLALMPAVGTPAQTVRVADFPQRDIGFSISEASLDAILDAMQAAHMFDNSGDLPFTTAKIQKLFPNAYNMCPDCTMAADVRTLKAPFASFQNGIETIGVAPLSAAISAVASNGTNVPLFTLNINASLQLENFTAAGPTQDMLKFALNIPPLAIEITNSHIGILPGDVIASLLNQILHDAILPAFNAKFPGIPLVFKGMSFTQPLVSASAGVLTFGLNVNIPTL